MRTTLAAAVILTATLPATVAAQQQAYAAADFPYKPVTTYKVLRNGQEIGSHVLRFERSGGQHVVHIDIDYNVKLLGITAYRYQHRGREVWRGEQLQSLETRSDNNGRKYAVRAERTADGLMIERERPAETSEAAAMFQGLGPPQIEREMLPAGTLPTSLWNVRQVRQSNLLNTHYGKICRMYVVPTARERVPTAGGSVEATRYTYTGDIRMDQWFDDRGHWVRAAFKAFDGSVIEYILQE